MHALVMCGSVSSDKDKISGWMGGMGGGGGGGGSKLHIVASLPP